MVVNSDGKPRVRVNYTSTVNRKMLSANHGQCPIGSLIVDAAAGVKFVTVCDVRNAHHKIQVAESEKKKKKKRVRDAERKMGPKDPLCHCQCTLFIRTKDALSICAFWS